MSNTTDTQPHNNLTIDDHVSGVTFDVSITHVPGCTDTLDDPALLSFGEKIRRFAAGNLKEREHLRPLIIRALTLTPNQVRYMRMAIMELFESSRPGRLDDAVDILSHVDSTSLTDFINSYWWQDSGKLLKDDYCVALIYAAAKKVPDGAFFTYCRLWLGSGRRPIREAVVEALGSRDDTRSLHSLEQIAQSDDSEFIRHLAQDVSSARRA